MYLSHNKVFFGQTNSKCYKESNVILLQHQRDIECIERESEQKMKKYVLSTKNRFFWTGAAVVW